MRGRPGCPTGQEKKPVGATGSNPLFYKERLGTESPPHPPQCAHWGTFPPRGRLWAWVRPFPTTTPTFPSPPSWGAGRYGPRIQGRRPGKKRRRTPAGSPQTRKGGSREEEPLPPWCSFLRLSSKESRAPPPESAGETTLQGRDGPERTTRRRQAPPGPHTLQLLR